MSITLKSSIPLRYCVVLYNFHEEYATIISIKHKLLILKLELCNIEKTLNTLTLFIAILMILTKFLFNLSVWLTEQSVTVGSVI